MTLEKRSMLRPIRKAIETWLRRTQSRREAIRFSDFRAINDLIMAHAERTDLGDTAGACRVLNRPYEESQHRIYPETGTPKAQHLVTNITIEPDGPDGARARSYFTVLQATDELPLQAIICGVYHDRFERSKGTWRFADRRYEPRLWGDLTQHLKSPPPAGRPLPPNESESDAISSSQNAPS
jgi:uncharacterized protein YjiS (DUF1127 family)